MAENVQSAMLEILKRLQTDSVDVKKQLGEIDGRLSKLETQVKKQNADSAAMLVIMRATVRDFNERITEIEDDIRFIKRKA
jgi:septal ring factor EnvC (AmiA/AmiB activator)